MFYADDANIIITTMLLRKQMRILKRLFVKWVKHNDHFFNFNGIEYSAIFTFRLNYTGLPTRLKMYKMPTEPKK